MEKNNKVSSFSDISETNLFQLDTYSVVDFPRPEVKFISWVSSTLAGSSSAAVQETTNKLTRESINNLFIL